MIRIDNDPSELAQFVNCTLSPVSFREGMTLGEWWKQSNKGITYLCLTASKNQPEFGASVHVTVVRGGQILHATSWLLKSPLVSVQEVIKGRGISN
jgi:hypothetical protein